VKGWSTRILRALTLIFAVLGLAAAVIGAMIAVPLTQPPALESIRTGALAIDQSGLPALSSFLARDGTSLAYRLYPSAGDTKNIAIVIHGSAGDSVGMNQIAKRLTAENFTVVVPDIRGHGASGTRGDIAYYGELDDDFADLLANLRRQYPQARFSLLGFSLGGGYALRLAAGKFRDDFDRLVLLSPFLGPDADSTRQSGASAPWTTVDISRIIALFVLHRVGLNCCEALPVIAYAVAPDARKYVTPQYSFRLLSNFSPPRRLDAAFHRLKLRTTIIAGGADELMVPQGYADLVRGIQPTIDVKILPALGHMDMLHVPAAIDAVAAAFGPP
jgi:pimeloyl-ACP methyl ester carboxylesterase